MPSALANHYQSSPQTHFDADYDGPRLSLDLSAISRQAEDFAQALPMVDPHYAVKANPHPAVLRHLKQLGVKFEIASEGELELLKRIHVPGEQIIFSNPIKTPSSIRAAEAYGVRWFAVDCLEELKSLEQHAPLSNYELRLPTDGQGSVWPLSTKFGATDDHLLPLLEYAANNKLNLCGVTFHVGSQCTDGNSWITAIERAQQVLQCMSELGLTPRLFNIGGGFPCQVAPSTPSIESLAESIRPALERLPASLQLVAEPGRYLVASAGTLECQVINTTHRHGYPWAYLDCGYYNGLIEMSSEFGFRLQSSRQGEQQAWVIAGPTCDSMDTFSPHYQLPSDTQAGDLLRISNVGAYSVACACDFNGFEIPKVEVIAPTAEGVKADSENYAYT
ncbi:MAG: decarboxylase [Cellvibrionaceae bacterium]|nr:decarboxylase [Cellvibrionaceae bacterium]